MYAVHVYLFYLKTVASRSISAALGGCSRSTPKTNLMNSLVSFVAWEGKCFPGMTDLCPCWSPPKTEPSWRHERSPFNISIWRHPVFQTSRLSTCSSIFLDNPKSASLTWVQDLSRSTLSPTESKETDVEWEDSYKSSSLSATRTRTTLLCKFHCEKQQNWMLCSRAFHFCKFLVAAVFVLSTTWNDLFCNFVDNACT